MTGSRSIFVPGVGQHDNIGDIILRRQLLDWLRPHGTLHVYVGGSTGGYDEGLGLSGDDHVYHSFRRWYVAALRAAIAARAHYVFKPGEIQLSLKGMKEHVGMLPVIAAVRARRGVVLRVGVGSRDFRKLPRLLMVPSIALSNLTLWRDAKTASFMRRGGVMPDLAFGEGHRDPEDQGTEDRRVLIVSLRSDRPYPSADWLQGVAAYAAQAQLDIWAVTQVLRDDERSTQLAADLGGRVLGWDGQDHHVQEERLRALYRRSAVAVSDRLHVLVAAFTEGAVPVGLTMDGSDKIDRHFAAAGISDISRSAVGLDAVEITATVTHAAARSQQLQTELTEAQRQVELVRGRVVAQLVGSVAAADDPSGTAAA